MHLYCFPLLFSPGGEYLCHFGIRLAQDPEVLFHRYIHLWVPSRVDERLSLQVLRVILFLNCSAHFCYHVEGVELELPSTSILLLGVKRVATPLYTCKSIVCARCAPATRPLLDTRLA